MGKGQNSVPVIAGGIVGLLFFSLASIWLGKPVIPTMNDVEAKALYPAPEPLPPVPSADEETGEQVYGRVCAACHQGGGKGLPPAFPPLAGSSWVTGDIDTPIRIVLRGLGGNIEVAGATYNQVMPTQGALSDEQIAKVLTFVRSSFGNKAGEVSTEQVAAVRAATEGKSGVWSAADLQALRGTAETELSGVADGSASEGAVEAEVAEAPDSDVAIDAASGSSTADQLAEAKKNFETVCVACHGVQGDGAGPAGLVLQPKPANFTDGAFWASRNRALIVKAISEGGPAVGKSPLMAPFGAQFSPEQIGALADYVMGFAP